MRIGLCWLYEGRPQRTWKLMEQWFLEERICSIGEELAMFEQIICKEAIDALVQGSMGEWVVVATVGLLDQGALVP